MSRKGEVKDGQMKMHKNARGWGEVGTFGQPKVGRLALPKLATLRLFQGYINFEHQ